MLCCFSANPPDDAKATGRTGLVQGKMLQYAQNPDSFQVNLQNACCKNPCCCLFGTALLPCGISSCWARKRSLETFGNGMNDYQCCQGYMGDKCCCCSAPKCQGSSVGLCLESLCCPILSMSISRIYVMEQKLLHPDPADYQIIRCSNCLQCAACICHIFACFCEEAREGAQILQCIADCYTCSMGGCMAAQIKAEVDAGPRTPMTAIQYATEVNPTTTMSR